MKAAVTIFRFLQDAAVRGERTVLVTLTDVIGSSSREPGTHMAVCATGAFVGSLSGGCVEAAVVAEALAVLERGRADLVRFGTGSRYIDIRLPCGGGIDLLFTPDPPLAIVADAIRLLEGRWAARLLLGREGEFRAESRFCEGWSEAGFTVLHQPDLRLVIIGHGTEVVSLARLAKAYAADVIVLSPDQATLSAAGALGAITTPLLTPASTETLTADARTAIVFLFHDHDWEPALMLAALTTPAFFIGAMGSRRTHALRTTMLSDSGATPRDIARIIGPIGLIGAARDPDTLGLSVLAQIVKAQPTATTKYYIPQDTALFMKSVHSVMQS